MLCLLEGVAELYLQLKADVFPVQTMHADRGRDFINKKMKTWLRRRGVLHSTNAGEDPRGNGRAGRGGGQADGPKTTPCVGHGSDVVADGSEVSDGDSQTRKKRREESHSRLRRQGPHQEEKLEGEASGTDT